MAAVEAVKSGTASANATPGCRSSGARVHAPPVVSSDEEGAGTPRTAPPRQAGAALSGWPSRVAQRAAAPRAPRPRPNSASARRAPAASAAADEPSPRATGMSDVASIVRPGGTGRPAAAQARTKPRTSRSSPAGRSPSSARAPARVTRGVEAACVSDVSLPNTSSPNVSSPNVSLPNVASPNVSMPNVASPNVADAVSHQSSATPTQSKPAPRLLVEAGTRTAARAAGARAAGTRIARALTARARRGARRRPPHGRGRRAWRRSRWAGWPTCAASPPRRGRPRGRRAARQDP